MTRLLSVAGGTRTTHQRGWAPHVSVQILLTRILEFLHKYHIEADRRQREGEGLKRQAKHTPRLFVVLVGVLGLVLVPGCVLIASIVKGQMNFN